MSVRSRTIVVTGSASGMGEAVTRHMRWEGTEVVGVDLRNAEIECDLATEEGCASALEVISDRTQGRIDGLVTCAGLGPHVTPTIDILRVNYFGTVRLLDGLLPLLRLGDSPAAVTFASNAASLTPVHPELLECLAHDDEERAMELGEHLDGITVYGMSKLAVVRAIRHRARTWGVAGVRINAVAPGPIDTPMLDGIMADPKLGPVVDALPIPLGRRGTPDDVVATVQFLLAETSTYVHGAVLFVDGGSDAELRPDAL